MPPTDIFNCGVSPWLRAEKARRHRYRLTDQIFILEAPGKQESGLTASAEREL